MHLSSKGLFEEKTIDAMKSVNYIVSFEIISAMVKKKKLIRAMGISRAGDRERVNFYIRLSVLDY